MSLVMIAVYCSVTRYTFCLVSSSPWVSAYSTNFGLSPIRLFSSRKVEILTQVSGYRYLPTRGKKSDSRSPLADMTHKYL